MPLPAKIAVAITAMGCAIFLVNQIRSLRRQRRNLIHWEKDEPLEKAGDWD